LYQIAFRYGWDWKELAAKNRLRQPDTIYPGQRITLDTGRTVARAPAQPVPTTPPRAAPSAAAKSTPAAIPAPVRSTAQTQTVTTKPATTSARAARTSWKWPAQSPWIARFRTAGSVNKGSAISGELGQPVVAAANGSVLSAGRGLLG